MPHAPGRPRALRALAATALAAAALAGCGGDDGPAAPVDGAVSAPAQAATALTAPTPQGEEALPETTPEGAPPGIDDSRLPSGDTVAVALAPAGGSGPGGTATFIPLGQGLTRVVVRLDDSAGEPRPAHVHRGGCAAAEPAPVHALTDVVGGVSDTFVTASLAELRATPVAVDVHPAGAGTAAYVACGELSSP